MFFCLLCVFLSLEGQQFCSGRCSVSFHSLRATIFCFFGYVFYLFLSLYVILFILTLSLYRSCPGFFLIVTHLWVWWVLPDQLLIGGSPGDTGPYPLGTTPWRPGWSWGIVPHTPSHRLCGSFTVQHAASCRCVLSVGSIPTSLPCQARPDAHVFSLKMWHLLWSLVTYSFLGSSCPFVPAYTASPWAVETHAVSYYTGGGMCFFLLLFVFVPRREGGNVIFTLCFTCEVSSAPVSSRMKLVWF